MFKNTAVVLTAVLATLTASGVTAAPSLFARDGTIQCGSANDPANQHWNDYRPVHGPDGYNVLIQQIAGCCEQNLANKWIAIGDTNKCSAMLVGKQFADFSTQVFNGGFYADKNTCVEAFKQVVSGCYDHDWNFLGGCRFSPDGNFRTCIYPHGDWPGKK